MAPASIIYLSARFRCYNAAAVCHHRYTYTAAIECAASVEREDGGWCKEIEIGSVDGLRGFVCLRIKRGFKSRFGEVFEEYGCRGFYRFLYRLM